MSSKQLAVHGLVFLVSAGVAWRASVAPEVDAKPLEVELWKGKAEDVKRITYKSAKREVELLPKADAQGRYVTGTVTKTVEPPAAASASADAGANSAPIPPSEPKLEKELLVGVKDANALVDNLATLRASRSLGTVSAEKLNDFGLTNESAGTLSIELTSGAHTFVIGGRTPGGSDVYVQDKDSSAVFVLSGDTTRDVELAENRVMERELLASDAGPAVGTVVLTQGDKRRSVIRSKEHSSFWTDESRPNEKNETLSNWMKKFERLRINSYPTEQPQDAQILVAADFRSADGKELGKIELAQQTLPNEDKPRFLARSTQTRLWGVVLTSSATELAQDLPSVME
jgi:hypothetical protein